MTVDVSQSESFNEPQSPIEFVNGVCRSEDQVLRSKAFRQIVEALGGRLRTTPKDFLRVLNGDLEGMNLDIVSADAETILSYYTGPEYSRAVCAVDLPEDFTAEGLDSFQEDNAVEMREEVASQISRIIKKTYRRVQRALGKKMVTEADRDRGPKVCTVEVSGAVAKLPPDYLKFADIPLVISAGVRTDIDYSTASNKRKDPFHELEHNPCTKNSEQMEKKDWIGVPLKVGQYFMLVYIRKTKGVAEMEAGLLNLFPLAKLSEITSRKPDGVLVFGDPDANFLPNKDGTYKPGNDYGFHIDDKNGMVVGVVPKAEPLEYIGYLKKAVLTIHNVMSIEAGEFPLHCGCYRYVVKFDEKGVPQIVDIKTKADDMGSIRLAQKKGGGTSILFRGTETGAFACLDGFSSTTKQKLIAKMVGFNRDKDVNARITVNVTDEEEINRPDEVDFIVSMQNYGPVDPSESTLKMVVPDEDAKVTDEKTQRVLEIFRWGRRVAAGGTAADRGSLDISYWANPFPVLKKLKAEGEGDDEVLHPRLYKKFRETKAKFAADVKTMVQAGSLRLGVAYSQLMAGVYLKNSFSDLARVGCMPDFVEKRFEDAGVDFYSLEKGLQESLIAETIANMSEDGRQKWRKEVEKKMALMGPRRLAKDIVNMVLDIAVEKREKLLAEGKEGVEEVSVTGIEDGDSATAKSESLAAMQEMLGL